MPIVLVCTSPFFGCGEHVVWQTHLVAMKSMPTHSSPAPVPHALCAVSYFYSPTQDAISSGIIDDGEAKIAQLREKHPLIRGCSAYERLTQFYLNRNTDSLFIKYKTIILSEAQVWPLWCLRYAF